MAAFAEKESLELIFATFNTMRKYRNLQNNPHVSLVIGWDDKIGITIQYEGIVRELSGQELEECRELHVKKNPKSAKYVSREEQRYFLITPRWIRYSNYSKNPQEIFELGAF